MSSASKSFDQIFNFDEKKKLAEEQLMTAPATVKQPKPLWQMNDSFSQISKDFGLDSSEESCSDDEDDIERVIRLNPLLNYLVEWKRPERSWSSDSSDYEGIINLNEEDYKIKVMNLDNRVMSTPIKPSLKQCADKNLNKFGAKSPIPKVDWDGNVNI